MRYLAFTLTSVLVLCIFNFAQASNLPDLKNAQAARVATSPKIDGQITEQVWSKATVLTDFLEFEPNNGAPANERTEVRILYDDVAIYISANLYDTRPDEIQKQLGDRDSGDNVSADLFGIAFDTYDDDQNGFAFFVSAAGVQTDARISQLGYDGVWDAVWKSAVQLNGQGWTLEMEIPFSALRFPQADVQTWGLHIERKVRRTRKVFTWNLQSRAIEGDVNQWGVLSGLTDLQPPLRLSLTPYVSGYVERYSPGKTGTDPASTNQYFSAGADLKFGLTESFTLDMTLVPDFGQVRSDNQVLNLGPFEVFFQENRPFFTEGTELFNIANVFYSRRIGARPRHYWAVEDSLRDGEEILENPSSTRLVNAFKLSGRTRKKTGLGFFNAMTSPSKAIISGEEGEREMETQAFTNYNVAVADQSLGKNSFVSLINTNRIELDGFMANVTASRVKLADNSNTWFVQGEGAVSQRWEDIKAGRPEFGHKYFYRAGKASGNFTFHVGQNIESDTYNPNDMGFLMAPNEFTDFAKVNYNIYKPFWKLAGQFNSIRLTRQSLYKPYRLQEYRINAESYFQMKSFDFFGVWGWVSPGKRFDFFEPRVMGRVMNKPGVGGWGGFISTNYARRWALDINYGSYIQPEWEGFGIDLSFQPRFRLSDRCQLQHNLWYNINENDRGFVAFDEADNSLIGTRDRKDLVNTFTATYAFSPRMNINFRARHYWSRVSYDNIEVLQEDGELGPTSYDENHNINFNAFNIDCIFRWRFAPGSDIFIVWKNSILESGEALITSYPKNLRNTFESPQVNSLSVRVLYFLDFARFRRT